jgi:hypothetical protein
MKIANRCFEMGTTLTKQNSVQEEIKSKLKSVQNLLSASLLSKNVKIKIFRTIIMPVILHGCEAWPLTMKEECRLRVFENREKVTGEWRKLHNKELNDLYSSPKIVRVIKLRRMRWAGHVACMGDSKGVYWVLVGKPEGKKPLGRPRHGWKDNINMDLQEVGCGGMEWIDLAQDKNMWQTLGNAVMNLQLP